MRWSIPRAGWRRACGEALRNTLVVGGAAAVVTVLGALFLTYGVKLTASRLPRRIMPITTIGYAAPGAVLGVGILIPLAAADNAIADAVYGLTGWDPGLMMTGTAFAVVYAYSVRFFAIAQGAAEGAMDRVSPSLPMAARSLGRTAGGALREIYVPLIRGSVGTALLLVFVDSVKELPATLLLRPFNYNTLVDTGLREGLARADRPGGPGGDAGDRRRPRRRGAGGARQQVTLERSAANA